MPDRGHLPRGMTPRLLSRNAAATYLGIGVEAFDEYVAPVVRPVEIGRRRLWDLNALDRWVDQKSGLAHARDPRPMGERLNGDQGERR
jgi:hypothetical protein